MTSSDVLKNFFITFIIPKGVWWLVALAVYNKVITLVKLCVLTNKLAKYERRTFIWPFTSSDLRLLRNERWIFSKIAKISDFRILLGWNEKSDSSWNNSYCVRSVVVLLAVNIGKLQSLVSKDSLFCWVKNDFCSDFLLCDVRDFVRM